MKVKINIKDGFVLGNKMPFMEGELKNEEGENRYEYRVSVDNASTLLHFEIKDCATKKAYHATSNMQDAFKSWLLATINKIEREREKEDTDR